MYGNYISGGAMGIFSSMITLSKLDYIIIGSPNSDIVGLSDSVKIHTWDASIGSYASIYFKTRTGLGIKGGAIIMILGYGTAASGGNLSPLTCTPASTSC